MTEQEQRIAIAEACGWENAAEKLERGLSVPDYLHDLNAMHEAESVLAYEQWWTYSHELDRVLHGNSHDGTSYNAYPINRVIDMHKSTAAQRAEAFLRAIGKWKGLTP